MTSSKSESPLHSEYRDRISRGENAASVRESLRRRATSIDELNAFFLAEILVTYFSLQDGGRSADFARRQVITDNQDLKDALEEYFKNEKTLLPSTLSHPTGTASQIPDAIRAQITTKYELLEELGRGSFGTVFKARLINADLIVALKLLLPGSRSDRFLDHVIREARALGGIQHTNIPEVKDVQEIRDPSTNAIIAAYFTTRFIDGRTLVECIATPSFPVPAHVCDDAGEMQKRHDFVACICGTIADALSSAHNNKIIHKDLKPANIILDKLDQPHVIDFGLARGLDAAPAEYIEGTPQYMAPEQLSGTVSQLGAAVDIYSIGAMMYELLTGVAPREWQGGQCRLSFEDIPSPTKRNPKVDNYLAAICMKCLATKRASRYPDTNALNTDLNNYLCGHAVTVVQDSITAATHRRLRRDRKVRAAIQLAFAVFGIFVLAATLGFLGEWYRGRGMIEHAKSQIDLQVQKTKVAEVTATREAAAADFEKGVAYCSKDDLIQGVLWIAAALLKCNKVDDDLERACRVNLAIWSEHVAQLNGVVQHGTTPISAIECNPNSDQIATVSNDGSLQIWDGATLAKEAGPFTHGNGIMKLAWSGEADQVASLIKGSGELSEFCIWDIRKGIAHTIMSFPTGSIPAHGPHLERFVSMYRSPQQPELWAINPNNQFSKVGLTHDSPVQHVVMSPDGARLATVDVTRNAFLWDTESKKKIAGPLALTQFAIFSSDSKLLVTFQDTEARLHDVDTGDRASAPFQHDQQLYYAQMPSAAGPLFTFTGDKEGKTRMYSWNVAEHQVEAESLTLGTSVTGCAMGGTGIMTLWHNGMKRVSFWDTNRRIVLGSLEIPDGNACVAQMPNRLEVAMSTRDGLVTIITPPNPSYVQVHWAPVTYSTAMARTGEHLQVAGKQVNVLDAEGKSTNAILQSGEVVTATTMNADGSRAATLDTNGTVQLWDIRAGQKATIAERSYLPLLLSPDGRYLLFGKDSLRLWDCESQKEVLIPSASTSPGAQSFDDNGRHVAFATPGRLACYDTSTFSPLGPEQPCKTVRFVVMSNHGTWAALAPFENEVRLTRCSSGVSVSLEPKHNSDVTCIDFNSADGLIASASTDETVHVHQLPLKNSSCKVLIHDAPVHRCLLFPDGKLLLTATDEGSLQMWDTVSGYKIGPARAFGGRVLAMVRATDGRSIIVRTERAVVRFFPPKLLQATAQDLNTWLEWRTGWRINQSNNALQRLSVDEWQVIAGPASKMRFSEGNLSP